MVPKFASRLYIVVQFDEKPVMPENCIVFHASSVSGNLSGVVSTLSRSSKTYSSPRPSRRLRLWIGVGPGQVWPSPCDQTDRFRDQSNTGTINRVRFEDTDHMILNFCFKVFFMIFYVVIFRKKKFKIFEFINLLKKNQKTFIELANLIAVTKWRPSG